MYKVMLVDDERVIRQGLRKLMDWTSLGFEIIDESEDGISALEKIKSSLPDLVLLDIHMPGLDGVTLLKEMRNLNIQSKVIFLTGYAEFAYAKEAITLNVEAYLTKPIDEIELEKYLRATYNKLEDEKAIKNRLRAQSTLEEKHHYRQLLFGHELNETNVAFDKGLYTVAEIQFNEDLQIANTFFDGFQKSHTDMICLLVAGSWILIFKDFSLTKIKVLLSDLSKKMKTVFKEDFFICVGRQVTNRHALHQSFEDVKVLGQRWFLNDQYSIVCYEEENITPEEQFFIDSDLLFGYIEVNNTNDIEEFFELLEQGIRSRHINFNKVKGLCSNCLLIVMERIKQNNVNKVEMPDAKTITDEIYEQVRLSSLMGYMKKNINQIQQSIHTNSTSTTISKLLEYIETHYARDLKLERLGKMFGYNSSYLGTVFKEHTGKNFSKYLDEIRIKEAKKLLLEHNNKVYEIAQRVGYNSVDYFHGKFKKYVHMSPKQFQLEHNQDKKEKGE